MDDIVLIYGANNSFSKAKKLLLIAVDEYAHSHKTVLS